MTAITQWEHEQLELAAELNFDEEQNESETDDFDLKSISQVVVYNTDWTTATILDQLLRENIDLNPRFQRRDAWNIQRKSRLIESLILGLPVPQIVLAERAKGKYLVLDGKQRLLTVLQFYNQSQSANNNFKLNHLELLSDLNGLKFDDLENMENYLDALNNQTIRTTIIRNWQKESFLYQLFLRLNIENTPLSPQELRQALYPGKFTDYLDDQSINSPGLKAIFGQQPDFRMRDNQVLLKYIAFQNFLPDYRGNLKAFLDETCNIFNQNWEQDKDKVQRTVQQVEEAVSLTIKIFGQYDFAKIWSADRQKYENRRNLSVLEIMLFYFSDEIVKKRVQELDQTQIKTAFNNLCSSTPDFIASLRSATNTRKNTYGRLFVWGKTLKDVLAIDFYIPELSE